MTWEAIQNAIRAQLKGMGVISAQTRDDARPPVMLRNGVEIVLRVTGSTAIGRGWDAFEEIKNPAGEVLDAYPTHVNQEHVTISIRFDDADDPDRAFDSIMLIRARMRRRRFLDAIQAAGGGLISIGDVAPASYNAQKRTVAAYAFSIVIAVAVTDREEDNLNEWIERFGFSSDTLPTAADETIVALET